MSFQYATYEYGDDDELIAFCSTTGIKSESLSVDWEEIHEFGELPVIIYTIPGITATFENTGTNELSKAHVFQSSGTVCFDESGLEQEIRKPAQIARDAKNGRAGKELIRPAILPQPIIYLVPAEKLERRWPGVRRDAAAIRSRTQSIQQKTIEEGPKRNKTRNSRSTGPAKGQKPLRKVAVIKAFFTLSEAYAKDDAVAWGDIFVDRVSKSVKEVTTSTGFLPDGRLLIGVSGSKDALKHVARILTREEYGCRPISSAEVNVARNHGKVRKR